MKTKKIETALIVGGGSGMGRAVAAELGRAGIRIFVADLNLAEAKQTAQAILDAKGDAAAFSVDVSSSASVSALFLKLRETAGRLDLLVHTAAILGRTVPIEDLPDEEWRRMMAINLDGVFYCCREAVRWMKLHQTGRIILFSSVASLTPTPGALHYSAAKGGINMLGKTLAQEVAKYNIRVNVVAPGYVATPDAGRAYPRDSPITFSRERRFAVSARPGRLPGWSLSWPPPRRIFLPAKFSAQTAGW